MKRLIPLAFIVFLIALAIPTYTITYGNLEVYLIKNEIAGVKYTPQCLGECHLPLNFSWLGTNFVLQKSDLKQYATKINGNLDRLSFKGINYLTNESYIETYNVPSISCSQVLINSSFYESCIDNSYTATRTSWRYVWKPIPDTISIQQNKFYIIDIVGYIKPSTRTFAVDIIPEIKGILLDEFAWWNSSFNDCRNWIMPVWNLTSQNFYLINQGNGENITNLTFANKNEIAIVNESCNNGGYEMPRDILGSATGTGNAWAQILVEPNITNGQNLTWSIYYNYTGREAPTFTSDFDSNTNNATQVENSAVKLSWGTTTAYSSATSTVYRELIYKTFGIGNVVDTTTGRWFTDRGANGAATQYTHNCILNTSGYSDIAKRVDCSIGGGSNANIQAFNKSIILGDKSSLILIRYTDFTTTGPITWNEGGRVPRLMGALFGEGSGGYCLRNTLNDSIMCDTMPTTDKIYSFAVGEDNSTLLWYNNSFKTMFSRNNLLGTATTRTINQLRIWDFGSQGLVTFTEDADASDSSPSIPAITGLTYNLLMGFFPTSTSNTNAWNITKSFNQTIVSSIGSEQTQSQLNPTNTSLWLNSNQNNLTLGYGYSNLNLTAKVNVTGLNVSILKNGTLLGSATTRYETTQNGLGVGYYTLEGNYTGNATYSSSSQIYYLTVSQAASSCSLSFIPSSPITYETQMKAICYCNQSQGTAKLYRNNTDVTAQNNTYVTLAAQGYNFICNITSSQNYSSATTNSNYIIDKKDANTKVYPSTQSFPYVENPVSQYCLEDTLLSCSVWRNNTSVSNNTNIILGVGTYNYVANISDTSNYTNYQDTSVLTITQANPNINITFNTSNPVITGTIVNVTCNVASLQVPKVLYNDTSAQINDSWIFDTTGKLGGYNFTCNSTATANYSANTTSSSLSVVVSGSLNIFAFDEKTNSSLTFNISVYNTTYTDTQYNLASYSSSSVGGDVTVVISKNGYIQRNYYIYIPTTNSTSLNTYLLDSSSGVYPTFWIYSAANPLGEFAAKLNVLRFLGTGYVLVAQQLSDVQGKGILYLDPYTTYKVNAENSDSSLTYNLSSYQANSAFILRINLGGGTTGTNITWLFTNTTYSLTPTDIYLRPNNVSNITLIKYTVLTGLSDISWYALKLIYWNGTILYSGNDTSSSGGSLSVNLNYNNLNGTVTAQTFLKKTGYDLFQFNRTYIVWRSFSAIPDILNEVKAAGFSDVVQSLIALFVAYCISLIINRAWRTGTGIVFLGILTGFTLYGWFNFTFILGLWMMEIGILFYREVN